MSTLFSRPKAAETKRQFKTKSRFNLFVFVTLLAAVPLRGEQPADKPLSMVDLIFDPSTIPNSFLNVPCPPGVKGKCVCCVNNYGSSRPERFMFRKEPDRPIMSSGVIHIGCINATPAAFDISPTLGMIQAAFPKVILLKATFSDGSNATKEELSGRVSEGRATTQENMTSGRSTKETEASNIHAKERQVVVDALQGANGDLAQAAKKLGISERALARKMKEYKIEATYR